MADEHQYCTLYVDGHYFGLDVKCDRLLSPHGVKRTRSRGEDFRGGRSHTPKHATRGKRNPLVP